MEPQLNAALALVRAGVADAGRSRRASCSGPEQRAANRGHACSVSTLGVSHGRGLSGYEVATDRGSVGPGVADASYGSRALSASIVIGWRPDVAEAERACPVCEQTPHVSSPFVSLQLSFSAFLFIKHA